MKIYTKPTKAKNIQRSWHFVDVKEKVLGRAAVGIAHKLMGKSKSYFVRNLDCGDYVVVVNASYIVTTGKKEIQKQYSKYSGYPSGLKKKPLWKVKKEKPEEVIRHAVMGMLPKNKLRNRMITRLHIYPDAQHPYKERFI